MKVFGITVEGIALCALCADPDAGKPVTRKFLETFHCEDPNCPGEEQIDFRSQCHPDAGFDAEYCKKHGTLTLVCHECHELCSTLRVARG